MIRLVLILWVLILALTLVGLPVVTVKHLASSDVKESYLLDCEYRQIKKILTRTDVLEEAVRRQHGKIIHRKWSDANLSSDKIVTGWEIDLTGEFTVQIQDDEVGAMVLSFRQDVSIGNERLVSSTTLAEPAGPVKSVNTEIVMTPEGSGTRVESRASVAYERRVPKSLTGLLDQKVAESAQKMLDQSRLVIEEVVEDYADKRFIIPIRPKG